MLRHGRAVDRSWLAGTLWPESDESQALHNLRDALVHLRKALGPERARLQSPGRDTLLLDLTGAEVDVVRFDAAMKAGDEDSLRCAVELYTRPLLEGCLEAWVFPEREHREQACLTVLETLAESAEQRGDYAGALVLLRRAEIAGQPARLHPAAAHARPRRERRYAGRPAGLPRLSPPAASRDECRARRGHGAPVPADPRRRARGGEGTRG